MKKVLIIAGDSRKINSLAKRIALKTKKVDFVTVKEVSDDDINRFLAEEKIEKAEEHEKAIAEKERIKAEAEKAEAEKAEAEKQERMKAEAEKPKTKTKRNNLFKK